jgi:hypothetical protein
MRERVDLVRKYLCGLWQRVTVTRYARALEEEAARQRAEIAPVEGGKPSATQFDFGYRRDPANSGDRSGDRISKKQRRGRRREGVRSRRRATRDGKRGGRQSQSASGA